MLVTSSQMRAIEERAFADGVTAEALMEEAGLQIARAVLQFFPVPGHCVVFFGKGHNGGDALVAARHLAAGGWRLELRPAFPPDTWAELTTRQHARLGAREPGLGGNGCTLNPLCAPALIVLDGLLGIGAGGALREPIRGACVEINRLRGQENAHVFALDVPTGLDGDRGTADPDAVVADFTLTIGFAKTGLVADAAINHVGRLAVLPLAELSQRAEESADSIVATPQILATMLARRTFETHKGQCGRVALVAGSVAFSGAAVMCAEAAVRGGAGLVTLYVPRTIHDSVASSTTPEVMVRPIKSPLECLETYHDVIAIGPGIGREHAGEVLDLIVRATNPMILDADALNILGGHTSSLNRCNGPRLLTPHPGEMARLDPDSTKRSRRMTVETFTRHFSHTLLLKGARSIIGERDQPLTYNSTGHPGLASGGIGDALTGLIAALIGQRLSLYDAACVGSWLIGRAAEIAIFQGPESAESLRATAVLEHLGTAFKNLASRCV